MIIKRKERKLFKRCFASGVVNPNYHGEKGDNQPDSPHMKCPSKALLAKIVSGL